MKYEFICCWCKKPTGNFTIASNSHGICSTCKKKVLEKAFKKEK